MVGIRFTNWNALVSTLLEHFHQAMDESIVTPTSAASRRLTEHHNALIQIERDFPALFAFARRWTEWVWRLSLVLHAAKWEADAAPVALEDSTVQAAITLVDWFVAQQLQLLGYGAVSAKGALYQRVLNLLSDQTQGLTATVLYRRRIVENAAEAHALLAEMEAVGKLVGQDSAPAGGGHTTRRYHGNGTSSVAQPG
jgi:hypothetical protein